MNSNDEIYTLYELFLMNNSEFPFWIKHWNNASTCLEVVGWSRYVKTQTYLGAAVVKVSSEITPFPEMPDSKLEDFRETGTFVGYHYYLDKQTRTNPRKENVIQVSGAPSRSWLFA